MKEKDNIDEYIKRFSELPPEEVLKHLGELRDFFLNNMTASGRKFFTEHFNK